MLRPFGWLYARIADFRNSLYEKEILKSYALGARTISVGNITAGGTGKTPLVAYVAEILAADGEKVCILTRGYGRENPRQRVLVSNFESVLTDSKTGGDEPVELAVKLSGKAIVVADADRVSAAEWALEKFGITAFVLDDAFQHRRVKRDLDIVCIDATNPFGNGKILPAGMLREPLANISRADAIVITRANLGDNIQDLRSQISNLSPSAQIFESTGRIVGLIDIGEFSLRQQKNEAPDIIRGSQSAIRNLKGLAFCGLGNPSNFFKQLLSDGFDLVVKKPFPDHHYYTQEDVKKIENLGRSAGAEALLTTAKDAVKLEGLEFTMSCFVVETELAISDPGGFHQLIISSYS